MPHSTAIFTATRVGIINSGKYTQICKGQGCLDALVHANHTSAYHVLVALILLQHFQVCDE